MEPSIADFNKAKQQCLTKEDLSRKGSIDEPIRSLVQMINSYHHYYTTSTCSGRVSLIEKPNENAAIKKGGHFLLNKHDEIELNELNQIVKTFVGKNVEDLCLWLKFEPFIMHIQCFNLESAQSLISVAMDSGCRNSGITVGKNDKYLVAIRSTSSMEIPLHCGAKFRLNSEYLAFLVDECNRRFRENFVRLGKFTTKVQATLDSSHTTGDIKKVTT